MHGSFSLVASRPYENLGPISGPETQRVRMYGIDRKLFTLNIKLAGYN
jgi:hypothetical protein